MSEREKPLESEETGDTLDLGIRAAFGVDPELDAPVARSILKHFRVSGKGSRISLRDPEEEHTPVALSSGTNGDDQPATINRYQVAGEIARGGIGSILKARDADLGRDVALKVLLNQHRENAEVTRRFLEEAQIAGQLEHPGIVPVHEIGLLADDRPYFAMKLVKGQTLAELLESRIDPTEGRQRFLGVFEQICQTLAYAHTRGVIHRDLKPSNVMVGAFGEVQIMDWGLAKVLAKGGAADDTRSSRPQRDDSVIRTMRSEDHGSASIAGSIMGTPAYMPPEQAKGAVDEMDERSDVFGLGAILCEILTGKPPYTGETLDAIFAKARKGDLGDALRQLQSCGADRELVDLAEGCLNVDPRQRPRSAVVVAKRIEAHLESVERRAHELQVRSAKTRLKLALAVFVLLGVVLGGGGYLWIDKQRRAQELASTEAVREATTETVKLRAQAAASGDASLWVAARREAQRAVDLAERANNRDLVASARKLHDTLTEQVRDHAMVQKLERLREELDADPEEFERSFREAFSSYGIDVGTDIDRSRGGDPRARRAGAASRYLFGGFGPLGPALGHGAEVVARGAAAIGKQLVQKVALEAAAARVRRSDISNQLVLALDQWALIREHEVLRGRSVPFEIAKRADTDAWRRNLRQAIEKAIEDENVEQLKQLASDAEMRQLRLEPSTLELLAFAFDKLDDRDRWRNRRGRGRRDRETNDTNENETNDTRGGADLRAWELRVRIRAQQLHPDDFWINVRLADFFLRDDRAAEAVQYLRAAVALRPASAHALEKLGGALAKTGSFTEALYQLRSSISIDPRPRRGRHYDLCREIVGKAGSDIHREELEKLLETLNGIVEEGREHYEEGFVQLRAATLFALGRRDTAILALEEFERSRRASRGRSFHWPRGPGRWGRRGRRGRRGRGPPSARRQLAEYRAAVRPDIVSFASIDALFDEAASEAPAAEELESFRALHATRDDSGSRARILYLDGRELQRAGKHEAAVGKFSEVVIRDDTLPEPFLRLAESLRESGDASRAETTLRAALERETTNAPDLWRLWIHVSFVDLARSAGEVLGSFPSAGGHAGDREPTTASDIRWLLETLVSSAAVRINCGGHRYQPSDGPVWGRDRFYTPPPRSFSWFRPAFFVDISGTDDDPLYQTERWFFSRGRSGDDEDDDSVNQTDGRSVREGRRDAGYEIPLPRGTYEVTLHFADTSHMRRDEDSGIVFGVDVEGGTARESYRLGWNGFATADHWSHETTVEDGFLDIDFVLAGDPASRRFEWPKICAIAVRKLD